MDKVHSGPRLVIICGLPGSGKTTHAKRLARKLRAIRLCPDEWMATLGINLHDSRSRKRIETLQWKLTQDLLRIGQQVIIEWGTWGKSERDTLRMGARGLGARVELHFLDVPIDTLFERIQRRNRESPPIQRADLLMWAETFERPSSEEMVLFDEPSKI